MEEQTQKETKSRGTISQILSTFIIGILLLGSGFFAGWYWQQASIQDFVKVDVVQYAPEKEPVSANTLSKKMDNVVVNADEESENCVFVGSKNSDKYHSPESGSARRIKESNKICFASKEEAEAQGYEAGTLK